MRKDEKLQQLLLKTSVGRCFLWVLSLLYYLGVKMRNKLYDTGVFKTKKVPAVVVSIGNVVAGGVGKTPLVHLLASTLASSNQVAIVLRGYKSTSEKSTKPIKVRTDMKASEVGDEALLLCQKLPTTSIWVCPDKVLAAQQAILEGAEIIILDDGFQHRKLERDFDVVVVDELSSRETYFLPRGSLRDLPSRIASSHLVAWMGPSSLPFHSHQVVFDRKISDSLKGQKVALFCAIANPERFISQVKEIGAIITGSCIKGDHDSFTLEQLQHLLRTSQASCLVCTEKDFVKSSVFKQSLPIQAVPLQIQIKEGEHIWNQFIYQIQLKVEHVRTISSRAS
jgi:tetraacyldisaccharide 4'-kinase